MGARGVLACGMLMCTLANAISVRGIRRDSEFLCEKIIVACSERPVVLVEQSKKEDDHDIVLLHIMHLAFSPSLEHLCMRANSENNTDFSVTCVPKLLRNKREALIVIRFDPKKYRFSFGTTRTDQDGEVLMITLVKLSVVNWLHEVTCPCRTCA